MVYRRKYVKRGRGRRYHRKKARGYIRPGNDYSLNKAARLQYYNFRRKGIITSVSTVANTDYVNAHTFQMSDIINPTDFSNLFEQFRLNMIVFRITILHNMAAGPEAAVTFPYLPRVFWDVDYDDATVPTLSTLRERQNCREFCVTSNRRQLIIKLRPRVQTNVYRSAGNVSFATDSRGTNPWLTWAHTDAPHYALKYVIESPANTSGVYKWERDVTYYFSCRSVH